MPGYSSQKKHTIERARWARTTASRSRREVYLTSVRAPTRLRWSFFSSSHWLGLHEVATRALSHFFFWTKLLILYIFSSFSSARLSFGSCVISRAAFLFCFDAESIEIDHYGFFCSFGLSFFPRYYAAVAPTPRQTSSAQSKNFL